VRSALAAAPSVRFFNCRIPRGGKLVRDDVIVEHGRIVDAQQLFWDKHIAVRRTDHIDAPTLTMRRHSRACASTVTDSSSRRALLTFKSMVGVGCGRHVAHGSDSS
jgi:hypothetical protein